MIHYSRNYLFVLSQKCSRLLSQSFHASLRIIQLCLKDLTSMQSRTPRFLPLTILTHISSPLTLDCSTSNYDSVFDLLLLYLIKVTLRILASRYTHSLTFQSGFNLTFYRSLNHSQSHSQSQYSFHIRQQPAITAVFAKKMVKQ